MVKPPLLCDGLCISPKLLLPKGVVCMPIVIVSDACRSCGTGAEIAIVATAMDVDRFRSASMMQRILYRAPAS